MLVRMPPETAMENRTAVLPVLPDNQENNHIPAKQRNA
jgi:hypothetical protein